jgi:hypothetical protein
VKVVFVDEVQKVLALLDEIDGMIERLGMRFILTGSSARKLRHGGANLLAGRTVTLRMHPLVVEERGDAFDRERALRLGALPAVAAAPEDEARTLLRDYDETYLMEEVQAESPVRVGPASSRDDARQEMFEVDGRSLRLLEEPAGAEDLNPHEPLSFTEVQRDVVIEPHGPAL